MAIDLKANRDARRATRRYTRVVGLAAVSVLTLAALLPISAAAQDSPEPTPTPHLINHEHPIRIGIDGSAFMMQRGPCVRRVDNAIMAHDDLFTGDPACDALIRQARAIQRQKEAEDPSYANEPRITAAHPGEVSSPENRIQLSIDGSVFLMQRGPCVRSVDIALMEHDDLFTGNPACDTLIRQARVIQRQKEAEDPSYANEPRIMPAPGEDQ
jgi:hypothetical protein